VEAYGKPQTQHDQCRRETYDEADLIASYEKGPRFLRFCIIDSTMRFLFYAYHMAVK
jgi:hypothetical protein